MLVSSLIVTMNLVCCHIETRRLSYAVEGNDGLPDYYFAEDEREKERRSCRYELESDIVHHRMRDLVPGGASCMPLW